MTSSRHGTWAVVTLALVPFLSLLIVYFSLSKSEKQIGETTDFAPEIADSNAAEQITKLFREGLRLSSDETLDDDTRLFGSALMENALERLRLCPEAVRGVWVAMSQQVESSEPRLKLLQTELMLDYVDRALVNCKGQASMQNVWAVRNDIVERQVAAERLLMEEAETFLHNVTEEIAALETELANERDRDSSTKNADFYEPSEKDTEEGTWRDGPYQNILVKVFEIRQTLDSDEFPLAQAWLDDDDAQASDPEERLVNVMLEANRMQRIRYNLWANRIVYQCRDVDPTTALTILSKIDSGNLLASVASLYSECEQEKLRNVSDAYQRSIFIRASLLTPKVPLDAF